MKGNARSAKHTAVLPHFPTNLKCIVHTQPQSVAIDKTRLVYIDSITRPTRLHSEVLLSDVLLAPKNMVAAAIKQKRNSYVTYCQRTSFYRSLVQQACRKRVFSSTIQQSTLWTHQNVVFWSLLLTAAREASPGEHTTTGVGRCSRVDSRGANTAPLLRCIFKPHPGSYRSVAPLSLSLSSGHRFTSDPWLVSKPNDRVHERAEHRRKLALLCRTPRVVAKN